MPVNEKLHGTWKLMEVRGDVTATLGKFPQGFFIFGRDDRAFVMITGEKRPKVPDLAGMTDQERIDLFKTMLAYGGTYEFNGKELKIRVDISWNGTWTGTEQLRFARLEGNRLELSTPLIPSVVDGKLTSTVLTWERLG